MSRSNSCIERLWVRIIAASRCSPKQRVLVKRTANRAKTGYNLRMLLAVIAMRLLEVMFFVGLAGSAVVVLISFFEDGKELIGRDEPPEKRA